MNKIAYPLRLFLDCSTAHLSTASRQWLDAHAACGDELIASTPYGWFLWVGEGEPEDEPADLATIKAHARCLGAEYLLFDRDAPESASLPTFHETEPLAGERRENV